MLIHRRMIALFALMIVSFPPASAEPLPLPRDAQIGPRPFYLVDKMKDGPLKTQLSQCTGPFHRSDFSIGHRGAALQFPEHSRESYLAAARMGAGVIECDVTFTKDKQLVCRHSQCDLHTTTNILTVPALAAAAVCGRGPRDGEKSIGEMLHQRHHARRIQTAHGQDGRLQSGRPNASLTRPGQRR